MYQILPFWLQLNITPIASVKRVRPPTQRVTLNNLTEKLRLKSFEECWLPLHWHYSRVHSDPKCRNCQDPIYQYSIIKCSWSHLTSFETLLHSLEWAAAGIGLHVNAHETEYMCYNQTGDISTLDGTSLKLVDNSPT